MWAATVLLLLALGSQLSIGEPTVSPPAVGFNFSLCKERERLCLVEKGAQSKLLKDTEDITGHTFLLAIWPYSEKKWRVTIQAKIATNIISLITLDSASAENGKLLSCAKFEDRVEPKDLGPTLSIDKFRGSHGANYFYCELTLQTSSNQIMPTDFGKIEYLQLRYGEGTNDYLRLKFMQLHLYLQNFKDLCNPDTIKFDEQLKISGQILTPIDEFSLTCPDNARMMYADETGKVQKATIGCVCTGTGDEPKKCRYKITPSSGSTIGPLERDKVFKAHCAQTVCALCKDVDCTTSCPIFEPAKLDDESSCATLTCDGDRFSINGVTTVSPAACAAGVWQIGQHSNVTAASCAKTVACEKIAPLVCDETCNVDADGLRCAAEGLTLSADGADGGPLSSVSCNNDTGIWRAHYVNGTTGPLPKQARKFSCAAPLAAKVTPMWKKHVAAFLVVFVYVACGCALCYLGDRKYGLGDDNDNPRMTEGLKRLIERERARLGTETEVATGTTTTGGQARSTSSTEPVKAASSPARKSVSVVDDRSSSRRLRTALPVPPTTEPPRPSPSLPRASAPRSNPPPSDTGEEQYEPIPGLEAEMQQQQRLSAETATAVPAAPVAAPAAAAVQPAVAPPAPAAARQQQPPSSGGAEYEELPWPAKTPGPPPESARRRPAAVDDGYEMMGPKSAAPPPPPSPGQQSMQGALDPAGRPSHYADGQQ